MSCWPYGKLPRTRSLRECLDPRRPQSKHRHPPAASHWGRRAPMSFCWTASQIAGRRIVQFRRIGGAMPDKAPRNQNLPRPQEHGNVAHAPFVHLARSLKFSGRRIVQLRRFVGSPDFAACRRRSTLFRPARASPCVRSEVRSSLRPMQLSRPAEIGALALPAQPQPPPDR